MTRSNRGTRHGAWARCAESHAYTAEERQFVDTWLSHTLYGSPETVRESLTALYETTDVDEFMLTTLVHDPEARLLPYELVAGEFALPGPAINAGTL